MQIGTHGADPAVLEEHRKGSPAANVVRALLDFTGPWTVRDLVDKATSSTGATYRVVQYLEREGW